MRKEIREANSSLQQLEPSSRSVQLRPHRETADSRTASTPKPRNSGNPTQEDGVESGEDELLATLDRIAQLATERENKLSTSQGKPAPAGTKPRIRPTAYDGVSSWDDYRAQFELVAELNGWDDQTKAIFLAASLQGPARAILGDLDPSKRRDFLALIEALESRFGSKHQTEMYRAQLRGRTKRRDETLPELAQAIQRLTRQAYPEAPASLRGNLGKGLLCRCSPRKRGTVAYPPDETEIPSRCTDGRPGG